MWQFLLLALVALVVIKIVRLCLFWSGYGIAHESFARSLYRTLWLYNKKPAYEVIREDVKRYGPVYGTYWGMHPALLVTDIEVAKDVLIKQFTNFFRRSFDFQTGDPLWDNNIIQLPYDKWKPTRALMGQCFTSSKMRGIIPKFNKIASRLVDKLDKISKSPENAIELKKFLKGYGMDSVVAISFGLEFDCIDNPDNDLIKHASGLFEPTLTIILLQLFPRWFKYIPFVSFPPKATSQFFGQLGKHVIDEKRKHLDEVIENNTADIIDFHLIAQREDGGHVLSDEVLAAQAFMFLIAGLDTTVVTLEMSTYFLAVNPDVQNRVYDEIKSVLGDRTEPTYADLTKMKLLEASIAESLRLVPISFMIDRLCVKDTEVAGVPIKKGTVVLFPLPYIHMDPKYFPEPEKFLPERFLKDGEVSSETAAFLPFGDGPKQCIGRRLAMMNIAMVIAKILLRLRLERCESTPYPLKMKPGMNFSNLSNEPLVIKLTNRE